MFPVKFRTKRVFPNIHILKINRMMSFCIYGTTVVLTYSDRPGTTS